MRNMVGRLWRRFNGAEMHHKAIVRAGTVEGEISSGQGRTGQGRTGQDRERETGPGSLLGDGVSGELEDRRARARTRSCQCLSNGTQIEAVKEQPNDRVVFSGDGYALLLTWGILKPQSKGQLGKWGATWSSRPGTSASATEDSFLPSCPF